MWNVLQHFWPYWDVNPVDWNAELDRALARGLADRSVDDHAMTLRRLSVAAPDGHAETTCPGETATIAPPFNVELIEGQVVVTSTSDPALFVGDVIMAVGGHSATAQVATAEELESGSAQWRHVRAAKRFGRGPAGSALTLSVRRRNTNFDVTITLKAAASGEPSRKAIERLSDGIYYVDLARATMDEINANMNALATAPGVIFDLREFPNGNHDVLSHLLTAAVDITKGFTTPHIIRPDHVPTAVPPWEASSTMLPAVEPHIAGRIAFLTGPAARSYAESVLLVVEQSHLGEIVGMPTAGTDGNIAEITEPSGCRTFFTGMRVTRTDGRRFHLLGVQPTIRASRTVAGVLAGRDEVFESALRYVRGATK